MNEEIIESIAFLLSQILYLFSYKSIRINHVSLGYLESLIILILIFFKSLHVLKYSIPITFNRITTASLYTAQNYFTNLLKI